MNRWMVIVGTLAWAIAGSAIAHQPVMDMAPRWDEGWGFQVRQEYRVSDDLLDGSSDAPNPFNRTRRTRSTWLEGVYTFQRELRVTLKVPWVEQERKILRGGVPVRESGRGFGDLMIGVPVKKYFNEGGHTGNFGITPSIRIPTGATSDSFPVSDGSWDFGLSGSYSRSYPWLYQFYDVFYWSNGSGRRGTNRGDEIGFDMNLGLHPFHDNRTNTGLFVMMDLRARYEGRGHDTGGTTGGKRLSLGPVLVGYRDNYMLRAEVRFPVYESARGIQQSFGTEYTIGLGVAF